MVAVAVAVAVAVVVAVVVVVTVRIEVATEMYRMAASIATQHAIGVTRKDTFREIVQKEGRTKMRRYQMQIISPQKYVYKLGKIPEMTIGGSTPAHHLI